MKKNYIIILMFFISYSIFGQLNYYKKTYTVFKKEKINDWLFIHTTIDNDSLLFVSKNTDLNKCLTKNKFEINSLLKRISIVKTETDSINFIYKTKDSNNQFKILTGNRKPGFSQDEKTYYSYNNPPFLIENCKDLKSK